MRAFWFALPACAALAAPPPDPRAISVHPFAVERGSTLTATVRGNALKNASGVITENTPLSITIESTDAEPPGDGGPRNRPADLVRLKIETTANATPGRYLFRLVTPNGISNALPLYVTEHPILAEPAGIHETPDTAVPIGAIPVLVTGRIARRGESDFYSFEASAGQSLTFEAISGLPSIGAAGGNAVGFDPSITILDSSGSWFDPGRANRIAFNDEPLWIHGRLTDAHLVHTFRKAGRYLLRMEAFSGQGGADYSYQLRILPGAAPSNPAPLSANWEERSFSRPLAAQRLNQLAERGGKPQDRKSIETWRPTPAPPPDSPLFKLPGSLEGTLDQPAVVHRARFQLDGPQDIAIEIETPSGGPPLFNPVVRLLDGAGDEVATNVFAGRGACTGALFKSIQSKTTVPLRNPGAYTIEIRDTTSDLAGVDFRYRVLVRPQIPHIGQVNIADDHVNLTPGDAKAVRVVFDREEDYQGAVAVSAEALPPGVHALAGADFEPDKDPPPHPGKRERYTARTERSVVVFTVSPDAPLTRQPHHARLLVRPIVDGKPGAVIATKHLPIMVVAAQ